MIKYLLGAAALFAMAAPMPLAAAAPAISATQSAEVRLGHISIVKRGRGSPVVLIPGLGSPREAWDGVTDGLLASNSVYLVQVNGFGGDAPGANLRPGILEGVIADLSMYLAREKVGRIKLAGEVWTARTEQDEVVAVGQEVTVLGIMGATALITAVPGARRDRRGTEEPPAAHHQHDERHVDRPTEETSL